MYALRTSDKNARNLTQLKFAVTAVAQWHTCRRLAATEIHRTIFIGLMLHWGEVSAFMGPIAKRLFRALAAGAPPVFLAGFNLDHIRRLLGNYSAATFGLWFRIVRHAIDLLRDTYIW
jgi:hypothetical protein